MEPWVPEGTSPTRTQRFVPDPSSKEVTCEYQRPFLPLGSSKDGQHLHFFCAKFLPLGLGSPIKLEMPLCCGRHVTHMRAQEGDGWVWGNIFVHHDGLLLRRNAARVRVGGVGCDRQRGKLWVIFLVRLKRHFLWLCQGMAIHLERGGEFLGVVSANDKVNGRGRNRTFRYPDSGG